MNNEITTIVAPVAKAGAASAVAGFVLGTLIGWLFFPDAMKPWQFGMILALVTLLLVLLAATPTYGADTAAKASSATPRRRPRSAPTRPPHQTETPCSGTAPQRPLTAGNRQ